ncbi:hypothetical protein [Treponema zioleckii]|uniref:hypothetical protein n=1 Tax=Treponema zioleckii TaxID=331680 RepID=UPI00168B0253|nr:hypothetical protein [Treponema zioleckii]
MPYPYFDGYDKYILHQSSNLYFDEVSKKYRGSFSISGQYQKELGYGTGVEFEFQPVPFFGIFLEQTVLKKNSESVTNLKAGGKLALLQYTKFSLYGDIGWGNISGDTSLSVGNGLLLAALIRSYPFRPFSLEWKNTFCFNPQKECWESYFGLGVFLNRTEFFSTYKYLRTINSKTDDLLKKSHGISSGIRVHF